MELYISKICFGFVSNLDICIISCRSKQSNAGRNNCTITKWSECHFPVALREVLQRRINVNVEAGSEPQSLKRRGQHRRSCRLRTMADLMKNGWLNNVFDFEDNHRSEPQKQLPHDAKAGEEDKQL